MTNWLDADEVATQTLSLSYQNEGAAWCVLEAIAALEPHLLQGYGCDENCNRNNPYSNAKGKPCDCTAGHFLRIWRVARVVVGKE